ncbi:MAG: hypothetical protein H5U36_05835 [Candidatus Caldatribacterium sp.]|nr:hypothetical protein [Candidatus Caldatribacterium sp.]
MRKTLLIFGLSWIILFCLLGVYLGVRSTAYIKEIQAAIEAQEFSRFLELQASWKHKTSAHAHALCLSFLTLFIALLMPHMVLPGKVKVLLGILLIIGMVLASIFGWVHVPPVMAVGDILIILGTILALWGILRAKVEG